MGIEGDWITRIRSKEYLKQVRGRPCLICGDVAEAHHLTYAQPRAMALKTGDQHTVPLCHRHHMLMHESAMPERTWWALQGIDPLKWAENNYNQWARENGTLSPENSSTLLPHTASSGPDDVYDDGAVYEHVE